MSTSPTAPSTSEALPSPALTEASAPKTLSTETSQNKLRPWKSSRSASTANTQRSKATAVGWAARQSERQKEQAIKALEKEMLEEKQAAADQRRASIKERRERLEEKKRLEEAAKRMSAKKLQRMKKRLGRSKKVAQ
ncbi:hypothetical protein P389DRAFT_210779 [Cystobasidium minutum MCA 4210]|uniref:uncharacterized protein n=1 Tax=Cystobasidium minutum MCA 4210 TaxID=1397322 RepID=UPI0034D01BC0|eukprot:jgi/Rhomi1/210779/estExt_Genemark1.C_4_t10350